VASGCFTSFIWSDKNNTISWIFNSLKNNQEINLISDIWRNPTHVYDITDFILRAIDNKIYGIYNIVSNELLTPYEIGMAICNVFNFNDKLINVINCKDMHYKAFRPTKTNLINTKARFYNWNPTSFYDSLKTTFILT
jgi:dTDP-4-dehydrorhamnose reductase